MSFHRASACIYMREAYTFHNSYLLLIAIASHDALPRNALVGKILLKWKIWTMQIIFYPIQFSLMRKDRRQNDLNIF